MDFERLLAAFAADLVEPDDTDERNEPMSWSLNCAGKRDDVLEQLKSAKGHGDPSQFDRAKAFATAEVEALPADAVVIVEGYGHHDDHSRNAKLDVRRIHPG